LMPVPEFHLAFLYQTRRSSSYRAGSNETAGPAMP
jgi:hypothetical protein